MLTKEDAERANKLYEELERLAKRLKFFKDENEFTINTGFGEACVPVSSDIAKQIGFKYFNDKSYDIKQQLADMGFSYEERKDGNGNSK